MADQLLSQADVDALVASLTQNEPAKPAATKPENPAAASAPKPAPAAAQATPPAARPAPAPAEPKPSALPIETISGGAPKKVAAPPAIPAAAPAPEVKSDVIEALNSKIEELTRQLSNMSQAVKRMDALEKKLAELENRGEGHQDSAGLVQKVQLLSDEMKKIVTNLKGTPGYGARATFSCDKCNDKGHVAVQYRCTNCGHERWYGWWPEKKK
jgi:hypothetical protein